MSPPPVLAKLKADPVRRNSVRPLNDVTVRSRSLLSSRSLSAVTRPHSTSLARANIEVGDLGGVGAAKALGGVTWDTSFIKGFWTDSETLSDVALFLFFTNALMSLVSAALRSFLALSSSAFTSHAVVAASAEGAEADVVVRLCRRGESFLGDFISDLGSDMDFVERILPSSTLAPPVVFLLWLWLRAEAACVGRLVVLVLDTYSERADSSGICYTIR